MVADEGETAGIAGAEGDRLELPGLEVDEAEFARCRS